MAKLEDHNSLIASAAKAALSPLGCQRKGKSRIWYADQRFWIIVIEFQPSSFSKASYLNVGAMWLWYAKDYFTFDEGHRIPGHYVSFENVGQFRPLAEKLAVRAAQEVETVRAKFTRLSDIYRHLLDRIAQLKQEDSVRQYHAAVAAGLVGDIATARQLFQKVAKWQVTPGEHTFLDSAVTLLPLLDDPVRYRSAVAAIVTDCRARLKLVPDPDCLAQFESNPAA